MERLLARSKEQVDEEEMLVAELKKIEMRKKEREKKQQDLQKLISAAEQNTAERWGGGRGRERGGGGINWKPIHVAAERAYTVILLCDVVHMSI